MRTSGLIVAGCLALAACAFVEKVEPSDFVTPPAQRATIEVPANCALEPDGRGRACALARDADAVVVLFLDDLMTPFDRMVRPDRFPTLFEREESDWERDLRFVYGGGFTRERHGGELTAWEPSAVPPAQKPRGAAACIRGDFAGTVESRRGEAQTWRSRQYICTWLRKEQEVRQDVGVEVVEIVAPGARAPLDYRGEADRIFATLRLR